MGKVVLIASGKGGVGKTFLTAGVGAALACAGRSVLVADVDRGLGNLDMAMGMSDCAVFNLSDLVFGRCGFDKAVVAHPRVRGLSLVAAAQDMEPLERDRLRAFCVEARDRFDYTLIDCPAGIGDGFIAAAGCADMALVVTVPEYTAVRDADKVAQILCEAGTGDMGLVVNRVRPRLIERGLAPDIDQIMDMTSLPLKGIVPEDEGVTVAINRGLAAELGRIPAAKAVGNIAARLDGAYVPLMRI